MNTADFLVTEQWNDGFVGYITIGNESDTSLDRWTLEFYSPFEITNIWNAQIVSRQPSEQGYYYKVSDVGWNSNISSGDEVSFGFVASYSGESQEPSSYILNDEPLDTSTPPSVSLPTLSVNDITVNEGDIDDNVATFEIRLSQTSDEEVTVRYTTKDGTAIAGSDYTATAGTVTFSPGETSKSIDIPIISDSIDEGNKTFTLELFESSNASIVDVQGTGTIIDDDESITTPPTTVEFSVSNDWGSGFTANLSITNNGDIPLHPWTLEFEAPFQIYEIWGAEFESQSENRYSIENGNSWNRSIPPGGTITFGFNAKYSGENAPPTNYLLNGQPLDSPRLPTLSVSDITVNEGDTGVTTASFEVKLSAASDETVTVEYATADSTTIADTDYNSNSGVLTFESGETTKTISVEVRGDTSVEEDETFTVNLSNASNAAIVDSQGVGTIVDDDSSSSLPELSIDDVDITEGDNGATQAIFAVSLSSPSNQAVSVSFNTENDTAIAGTDYTANTGILTFDPGETTQTISVEVTGDTFVENNETFTVNLSNPDNAVIIDSQGVATIINDDSNNDVPQQEGNFNYGEALQKSFLFYEAQRSGDLPTDNRIDWRDDSALGDGSDVGIDLSGGYYDAGDGVKFGFPMAASMTMLGWGVLEYRNAYEQSGQLDEVLEAIKWGTDYILKAHITDENGTREFWGQVGDGNIDHDYWGPPEEMTMERPAFKIDRQNPGSDLAGETAAALAAASIIFRPTNSSYADKLLENAEQLYEFADTYRGKYSDSIPDAAQFYNSWSGYQDELAWGAAWLYKATGDQSYLNKAENYYQGVWREGTHSWDNKQHGTGILLAQETNKSQYRSDVERWLNYWSNDSGAGISYTNGGLAWSSQWGSLRYTANTAFLAGIYSDTVTDYQGRYSNFAHKQINYILGDNPRNFSYMVGFGNNYALRPHHRAAHGGDWSNFNSSAPNDNILYGALVGGPASVNDFDYTDDRTDYIRNEVALDYNAGLTGALARMYEEFGGNPLSDAQLNALPGITVNN